MCRVARGYTVALSAITPVHDEARVAETLLDLRCEALVLPAPTLSAEAIGDLAARVPLVVTGRHVAPDGFDVVRVADDLGVARAVEHLLALGHRDLVHVDGGDHPSAAERRAGRVWNIVAVMSQNPAAMKASMGFYLAIMHGPSPLSRAQREMLAVVVSAANQCHY